MICCFFTLSIALVFPPGRSLTFFVLANDIFGVFVNVLWIASFISKIGQCFWMILDPFRSVQLYDATNCVQFSFLRNYVTSLTASFNIYFFSWFFWLLLIFWNCWADSFKSWSLTKGYDPFKDLLCFLCFRYWIKETLTISLFPVNSCLVFLLSSMYIFVSGKAISSFNTFQSKFIYGCCSRCSFSKTQFQLRFYIFLFLSFLLFFIQIRSCHKKNQSHNSLQRVEKYSNPED